MGTGMRMNPDALESAAGQVSGIASNFGSELASLSALIQSTHDFWEGSSQAAFEAKYEQQYKVAMNQFIEALNEYATNMRRQAENQRNTEAANAQIWSI